MAGMSSPHPPSSGQVWGANQQCRGRLCEGGCASRIWNVLEEISLLQGVDRGEPGAYSPGWDS